jgi:hypothetical protein
MARVATWAACLTCLMSPSLGRACGFSEVAGGVLTLRQQVERSRSPIVLFGKLLNARPGRDGQTEGSTDLIITRVIKGSSAVAGKKVIQLPRFISIPDPKKYPFVLVVLEIYKGQLDPYHGVEGSSALGDYAKGLLAINASDHLALMRYAFNYLDHENSAIATDAFHQFITSSDPDIRTVARTLPAVKLRRWLQDPRTPANRLRLYGYLLGNCGEAKDAGLLRKLLDRLVKQPSPSLVDGILTGYTLLDPKAGWALTKALAENASTHFMIRYSALRAARYFRTTHPGIVTEKQIIAVMSQAVVQSDIADLAIEYLRQWKCWKLTGTILPLFDRKEFAVPIVQRSIVRYALQCPEEQAKRFVQQIRKTNPSLVEEAEEILEVEARPATAK